MSSNIVTGAQRARIQPYVLGQHILIVAGFTMLSLVLTYPLTTASPNAIVGTRIAQKDGWQTVWDLWWFGTALKTGASPIWTQHIFWPTGVNLQVYEAYGLSTLVQSLPVLLPFGPVAAYRWNMILNFTLSGYMMALVARAYTREWWSAIIAGILFTASPFHLSRFADGYDDLTALQWLPLYVAALGAWLQKGRWRYGISAIILLVVIYFTALYYTQFALIWTAAAWPIYSILTRKPIRTGLRTAAVLVSWAVICAPLLLPNLQTEITYGDYRTRQETHSVDVLDLVLPSDIHPLWRLFDPHRITHLYGSWNVVPGITVFLVGSYGLWKTRRTTWHLTALATIMLVFAMGPTLHIGGIRTGIPLPHRLLNLTSVGQASQRPNHFFVWSIIVLTLGIALALQGRRKRTMLLMGLGMFAIDGVPPVPWPTIVGVPPPWLQALNAVPNSALLELPIRSREIDYQYNQLWHGRPVTGGYVSRVPPDPVIGLPILQNLSGEGESTVLGGDEREQLRAAIGASCTQLMVIHGNRQPRFGLTTTQHMLETLLPEARLLWARDPLVYSLPAEPAMPILLPGEGWYDLEQDAQRRWQWTAPESTFDIVNPLTIPITIQLETAIEGIKEGQTVRLWREQGTVWQERLSLGLRHRLALIQLAPQERTTLHLSADSVQEATGSKRVLGVVVRQLTTSIVQPSNLAHACPASDPLPPALHR